jgi:hypothetical protein
MSRKRSSRSEDSQHDGAHVPTPEAFKQSLAQRLRTSAKTGAELARKRQLLVFEAKLQEAACRDLGGYMTFEAGPDLLAFAGIAPPTLRLYPIETHIAEKLRAYTMPRPRPNSRVKDLPDIALLATAQLIVARRLRDALLCSPAPQRRVEPRDLDVGQTMKHDHFSGKERVAGVPGLTGRR